MWPRSIATASWGLAIEILPIKSRQKSVDSKKNHVSILLTTLYRHLASHRSEDRSALVKFNAGGCHGRGFFAQHLAGQRGVVLRAMTSGRVAENRGAKTRTLG